jgi:hypothetical protein
MNKHLVYVNYLHWCREELEVIWYKCLEWWMILTVNLNLNNFNSHTSITDMIIDNKHYIMIHANILSKIMLWHGLVCHMKLFLCSSVIDLRMHLINFVQVTSFCMTVACRSEADRVRSRSIKDSNQIVCNRADYHYTEINIHLQAYICNKTLLLLCTL